jgi:hypothetical protein
MKKWVKQEIERWHDFAPRLNPARGFNLIPSDVQVGKILEAFNGSIEEAEFFISRQVAQEGLLAFDDGYWQRVEKRFNELRVNDEIMTE